MFFYFFVVFLTIALYSISNILYFIKFSFSYFIFNFEVKIFNFEVDFFSKRNLKLSKTILYFHRIYLRNQFSKSKHFFRVVYKNFDSRFRYGDKLNERTVDNGKPKDNNFLFKIGFIGFRWIL